MKSDISSSAHCPGKGAHWQALPRGMQLGIDRLSKKHLAVALPWGIGRFADPPRWRRLEKTTEGGRVGLEYANLSRIKSECVNAILMSVGHVVLIRVCPSGQVERTEPLIFLIVPRFYDGGDLRREVQQRRWKRNFSMLDGEHVNNSRHGASPDADRDKEEDGSDSVEDQRSCWHAVGFEVHDIETSRRKIRVFSAQFRNTCRQRMPSPIAKGGIFSDRNLPCHDL